MSDDTLFKQKCIITNYDAVNSELVAGRLDISSRNGRLRFEPKYCNATLIREYYIFGGIVRMFKGS